MTLSWDELNALIDDTLAAGEHPETRRASPMETIDNDGAPRPTRVDPEALMQSTLDEYARWERWRLRSMIFEPMPILEYLRFSAEL